MRHAVMHLQPVPAPPAGSDAGILPCEEEPPGAFFPPGERAWTDAADPLVYAELRAICASCRWRDACLALALDQREAYGVWGGTTPAERARIHLDAVVSPIGLGRTSRRRRAARPRRWRRAFKTAGQPGADDPLAPEPA